MQRKITHSRGSLAGVIGGLVVGVLMMYIGLFMIAAVYNATALNASTSPFATIQSQLVVTTGTIFTVLGLVIIVVALTVAIKSMMQVSGG